MKPLSAWDRLVFGAISAAFGVIIGALIALGLLLAGVTTSFNPFFVLFSGLYFFAFGVWRGAAAGDVAGAGLLGSAAIAVHAQVSVSPERNEDPKDNGLTLVILVVYVFGLIGVGYFS